MTAPASSAPGSVRFAAGLTTIFLVVAVATGLFLIAHAVRGAVDGGDEVSFRGAVRVSNAQPAGSVPHGVRLENPGIADVPVHIEDASTKQEMVALARDLLPVVLIAIGLWTIRRILRSVRDADPFIEANVRRLRLIAVLLMFVPFVVGIRHYLDNALAASVPRLTNWPNGEGLSLNGPAAGLIVLVLAEVFAHGVRLREDVEGTI